MPESNCKKFYSPMNVPELTLHYVPVPDKKANFTVDFKELV